MNIADPKLTVIIPFLNEASEIRHIVANLCDTANNAVDIILINDCSNNGYDYKEVAKQYHAKYVEHPYRVGVAASRDEGVFLSKTVCLI